MAFNEDTRVKIPAILHLCRLGYEYLSLEVVKIDPETNIFPDIFIQSIGRLNPDLETDDIKRLLKEIRVKLDNDDLGHAFYKMLISSSGIRLFDFNNLQAYMLLLNSLTEMETKSFGPTSHCCSMACRWPLSR
jgi:type I restriction enzyme R subunit